MKKNAAKMKRNKNYIYIFLITVFIVAGILLLCYTTILH